MTGSGAFSAANAGVLRLLGERSLNIHAVCGMQDAAWTAALHAVGYDAQDMEKALDHIGAGACRLFRAQYPSRALTCGRRAWLNDGRVIDRLLRIQTGEMLLGLCPRRVIFPCRIASSGKRVVFTTRAYACAGSCDATQQATVSFAARAAMGNPPFLAPLAWAGSYLLGEDDAAWAAQQLMHMGADRVLIFDPRADAGAQMDALELAAARSRWMKAPEDGSSVRVIGIGMPLGVHALDYSKAREIAQAGYEAARERLDGALLEMGMTQCRILPFRARAQKMLGRR